MSTLIRIDDLETLQSLSEFLNALVDARLKHYASDLFPELEMIDKEAFDLSLGRAQQVCSTLNLPVHEHFKRIYRTSGNRVYCDYKLSNTAYLLVSINGDVSRRKVAQIQFELVKKLLKNPK